MVLVIVPSATWVVSSAPVLTSATDRTTAPSGPRVIDQPRARATDGSSALVRAAVSQRELGGTKPVAGGESNAHDRTVEEGERTRLRPDRRPTKAGRRRQDGISAFERGRWSPRRRAGGAQVGRRHWRAPDGVVGDVGPRLAAPASRRRPRRLPAQPPSAWCGPCATSSATEWSMSCPIPVKTGIGACTMASATSA